MTEELTALQLYKQDAIEALADNERVIAAQKDRIAVLEGHLAKLRDLIWLGYCNSSGVLQLEFEPDTVKQTKAATRDAALKVKRQRSGK